MSSSDSNGSPYIGKGIPNIIEYGKAQLLDSEREFYLMYCFLEKHWITKPSDYEEMDPEIHAGLVRILELEAKKASKEESKMKAQDALSKLKARTGI